MRLRLGALSVVLLATIAAALPVAASSDEHSSPGKYYMSLGDSLAFGFQEARALALAPTENPAGFNTGYSNDFAKMLREVRENVRLVNYGCPGETTDSFINGPCPYPFALHNPYSKGSQLATAVAFLNSHRNQVNPITIDIGSNDATAVLGACGVPPFTVASLSCIGPKVPGLINQIVTNLTAIIATLHAASPKSEIIVLNLYNPLIALDSVTDGFASDGFAVGINAAIAGVATASGARTADVFSTFNPGAASNPGNAVELTTICILSAICTALHDIHASDAGYRVMANALFKASGFRTEDD